MRQAGGERNPRARGFVDRRDDAIDQVGSSHIDTDDADPTVSATFDSRIRVETGVARTTISWAAVPTIDAHNASVGEPTSNRANAKR
jgi:hypothetical protein